MENSKWIVCLILISILSACKSDDEDVKMLAETDVIPLKYIVIQPDGSNNSVNFEYSNKFIANLSTSFGKNISYTYTNSKLTSFQAIQNGDTLTTNLNYENNKLIESITEDGSLIISYSYNNSNQVVSTIRNENGAITTTFYEYDDAGNVITAQDDFSTLKFSYNERNNSFKNVFPQLDTEITWEWFGSQINLQQEVQEKLATETEFTTKYTYQYTFVDPNYFPSERRQIDANGDLMETVILLLWRIKNIYDKSVQQLKV